MPRWVRLTGVFAFSTLSLIALIGPLAMVTAGMVTPIVVTVLAGGIVGTSIVGWWIVRMWRGAQRLSRIPGDERGRRLRLDVPRTRYSALAGAESDGAVGSWIDVGSEHLFVHDGLRHRVVAPLADVKASTATRLGMRRLRLAFDPPVAGLETGRVVMIDHLVIRPPASEQEERELFERLGSLPDLQPATAARVLVSLVGWVVVTIASLVVLYYLRRA
jgi:hypothetical protein